LSREHALSYDGRYLAFSSLATNMVANDVNGVSDVFVRDLQTGYTALASISSLGAHADAVSGAPSLSLDGRYIGFASAATNLSRSHRH
jgi:Tol biopolymer transport system component